MRILFLLFWLCFNAQAIEIRSFDDATKQQRYETLIKELRCLVCQNQSLADSDADLAKDLRDEVYQIIQKGDSEEQAISFLVARYGDFVLYRPPVNQTTLFLWIGPFVLLSLGVLFIWRKQSHSGGKALTSEEQSSLKELKEKIKGRS